MPDSPAPTTSDLAQDTLTIINGGVERELHLRDGTTQKVKIRQLPIRLLDDYAKLQGDESALLELFCDKPKGFADELTIDSHEDVISVGEKINQPVFERWAERRRNAISALHEVGNKNLAVLNPAQATPTPLPVAVPAMAPPPVAPPGPVIRAGDLPVPVPAAASPSTTSSAPSSSGAS